LEKKQSTLLLLSMIALATILASTVPSLCAFSNTTQTPTVPEPPGDRPAPPWMANLTDTQRAALKQKIQELKAASASPQEIHSAIDEMLQEWGIQVPQCSGDRPDPPWMGNLTEQQREALKQKIEEMKAVNASPQEIRNAVDDMMQEWGIQVPQPPSDHHAPPWMTNLTDTQRAALEQKIEELKAVGKTPQEIHSAVDEMLQQWGIQVPQRSDLAPP